jgi:hypothetical protein
LAGGGGLALSLSNGGRTAWWREEAWRERRFVVGVCVGRERESRWKVRARGD